MGEHIRGTQPKEVRSSLHCSSMLTSLPGQTSRSRAARQHRANAEHARMPTDSHHAASRHHALTTTRTSAGARHRPIAAGCSHHFPASQAGAEQPRHKHTLPKRTKSVYGLARWETAQTPLPEHTHASQNHSRSKPQQIGGTEQMEAHLGFLSRRRSSRRFHTEVVSTAPVK